MPCLSRVLEFLAPRQNVRFKSPFPEDSTNEVWEYEGTLLVRLGRGAAMQVRLDPDRTSVVFRVVPIAKATLLAGDSTWQVASDSQLSEWLQPHSAVGRWLMGKGLLARGSEAQSIRRLDERALPVMSLL